MTLKGNSKAISVISKQLELIAMSNKKICRVGETKWNSDDEHCSRGRPEILRLCVRDVYGEVEQSFRVDFSSQKT